MYILFTYCQRRLDCNFITEIGMENFFSLEFLCDKIEYKEDEEYMLSTQQSRIELNNMDTCSDRVVFDLIFKN